MKRRDPARRGGGQLLARMIWVGVLIVAAVNLSEGQQAPPQQPSKSVASPTPAPSITPVPTPTVPAPLPAPRETPAPALTVQPTPATTETATPITRDEAIRLALAQASTFQQATLNERIAAEDLRQARTAFLPRVAANPTLIYTTPSSATPPAGTPRAPSFLGANAITEYQGLVNVSGELDTSGRLRATLQRNRALLEAARAGTEVARRALIQATNDAYFNLALATTRRSAAEQSLRDAEEFERITSLLLQGGEVAPVDATRARLQTTTRRDELEQARANESVAADSLRVLVGYDFTTPIATTDLLLETPAIGEIERFTDTAIANRPEFAQFAAERLAAQQDIRLARAERRPQITYSINGGFVTDSLRPPNIFDHTGASATVGVSIPLFDWGASRSRERQARLRAEVAESARIVAQRNFAQQFFSARAQALSAITRIRLADQGIAGAESNVRASVARYRAGEAGILEVTDAQIALRAQRLALYQALFDYQTARARLSQATGQ